MKEVPHNPRSCRVVIPDCKSCVKKKGRGPESRIEEPEGWNNTDVGDVSGREGV